MSNITWIIIVLIGISIAVTVSEVGLRFGLLQKGRQPGEPGVCGLARSSCGKDLVSIKSPVQGVLGKPEWGSDGSPNITKMRDALSDEMVLKLYGVDLSGKMYSEL
jgi:hypothetical protein